MSNGLMTLVTRWTATVVAVAAVAAVGATVEWATWKASRQALPADGSDSRRIVPGERVLVLGCPLRVLHRWRVRIAVRSTDPDSAVFVFSGGAVGGHIAEAQMMAEYAVNDLGVPARNVVTEDRSRTTVENIANSMPLLADSYLPWAIQGSHLWGLCDRYSHDNLRC